MCFRSKAAIVSEEEEQQNGRFARGSSRERSVFLLQSSTHSRAPRTPRTPKKHQNEAAGVPTQEEEPQEWFVQEERAAPGILLETTPLLKAAALVFAEEPLWCSLKNRSGVRCFEEPLWCSLF